MKAVLLTRDVFRESVFNRDSHKCVICKQPAKDAHHIIERRLFSDGGYYIDNGASLCEKHHIEAEQTTLSCDDIRAACKITRIILPEHLYDDQSYDKWGNIVLPSGQRIKGELFFDESVQKILSKGGVLDTFQKHIKYPRTYHLSYSQAHASAFKDDRIMKNDDSFQGQRVIASLKMDGENTTMYSDYIHARSLESQSHPTRDRVKGIWAQISYLLDDNMRVCGENMYAVHSMRYTNLPSYFLAFSIWTDMICLSWDETVDYAAILGLNMVPVFYDGIYDKDAILAAWKPYEKTNEGFTIRLAKEFHYMNFRSSVGKYVRPEFRQVVNNSHGHWISKKIEVNELATLL